MLGNTHPLHVTDVTLPLRMTCHTPTLHIALYTSMFDRSDPPTARDSLDPALTHDCPHSSVTHGRKHPPVLITGHTHTHDTSHQSPHVTVHSAPLHLTGHTPHIHIIVQAPLPICISLISSDTYRLMCGAKLSQRPHLYFIPYCTYGNGVCSLKVQIEVHLSTTG